MYLYFILTFYYDIMANKSFLEKRIEERAKARVESDMRTFADICKKDPILKSISIIIDWKPKPFMNCSWTTWNVFFNSHFIKDAKEFSNIEKIQEDLFEKYVKEETDELLKNMWDLEDFINKQELIEISDPNINIVVPKKDSSVVYPEDIPF